jgi:rifampicin phosphotransferase
MNKSYTLYFEEIGKKDLPLVGGKGANLGEMTKAGFTVPYGFCVTTESYKEFIEHNNLSNFISQTIKDANLDNISQIGDEIRKKLIQCDIPELIEQEIVRAVNKIGSEGYYAVRSSATAEDLAFASFAGQQDTYLNIKGEKTILDAVRDCWASLFTDRAILYRIQNKIEHEKVYMSVVVQKMVLPEVSGIMFTADPVSGHRGIVSIDASYGLGEALVSGLVSPDLYKFNKRSSMIDSKTIAEKKLAIMPVEGGGTEKVEITGEKSTNQVMEDSQIKNLAELGVKIEKHYGCPQDIEWCMEKGKLYIVQSRAITSLFPMPSPIPKDDALHAYVSFNHFQVMTDPISPLGIDMLRLIFSFDKMTTSTDEYKFVKSAAGRIYLDLSVLLQYKKLGKGFASFAKNADALISTALFELMSRPDFYSRIKKNKESGKALRNFILPIIHNAAKNVAYRKPEGTIEYVNTYIAKRINKTAEDINHARQGTEKLDAICKAASFREDFKVLLPRLAPAIISFKALNALEQKLLGASNYADEIVKGLEGNITTEMGLLVGDLADLVRKSTYLVKEFENEDYLTLNDRINKLKGHDEFKRNFNSFMGIYDMRAAGEIDMAKDRWIENPEPLAIAIMSIVKTSEEGIHRKEYSETIVRAEQAAEKLIKEVEAKHGKLKGKIVRRLIRVVRNFMPVREHPKYLIMKLILTFKKAFLEEAKILVQKGHLEEEKDIFYVSFWDLYNAIQNNESLIELVQIRKEEYQHFRKLSAPRVLTSEGEEIKAGYKRENLPEGALPGMPVSSGIIEGIARVITDPTKGTINKGEILVAPFTDPGWTPLFINAAGLVMEIGGLLTHGTVVAREYGIPAVVGITDATKKIKTGQKIRVDGNAGFVMIIEEQE